MIVVYCMLLWIFVSKCDSCNCVRMCRGVCMCVCARWCVYTCKGVDVCLHVGAWVCAMTSAAKLYCYCSAIVSC